MMICENDPEFVREHPGRVVDEGIDFNLDGGKGIRPCVVFLQDFLRAKVKDSYDPTQPLPFMPFLLINTPPDGNCVFYGVRNATQPQQLSNGTEMSVRTGLSFTRQDRWVEQERILTYRCSSVTIRQLCIGIAPSTICSTSQSDTHTHLFVLR